MKNRLSRRDFLSGLGSLAACFYAAPVRAVVAAAEAQASEPLPDFYGPYLEAIAAKVNARAKTYPFGFWFITDLHITANHRRSGKALAALAKKVPSIERVLCGGDLPEAFGSKFETDRACVDYAVDYYDLFWRKPIEATGLKVYTAKGNHDFTVRHSGTSEEGFTYSAADARRIILNSAGCRTVVTNAADPTACYYHFDDATTKTRVIVADTTDSISPTRKYWAVMNGLHAPQLQWLAEHSFATTPAGWTIVVMHHIPLVGCCAEGGAKIFAPFLSLLEAYQNRGTCTLAGKTYDFSKAGGWIACDITGHHHCERQTFRNGILHLTEPCDAAYSDYINGSAPWCGKLPAKKKGTVYEQTFGAVQIDAAHRLVSVTRVGGGQDRVLHATAVKMRVGETRAFAAPHLGEVLDWGCYDGDRISLTPNPASRYQPFVSYHNGFATIDATGRLTARKPGTTIVLARDKNLNKEIIPVEIS